LVLFTSSIVIPSISNTYTELIGQKII
jgi:hypothetical protein